jgi:hypothetical protein
MMNFKMFDKLFTEGKIRKPIKKVKGQKPVLKPNTGKYVPHFTKKDIIL